MDYNLKVARDVMNSLVEQLENDMIRYTLGKAEYEAKNDRDTWGFMIHWYDGKIESTKEAILVIKQKIEIFNDFMR